MLYSTSLGSSTSCFFLGLAFKMEVHQSSFSSPSNCNHPIFVSSLFFQKPQHTVSQFLFDTMFCFKVLSNCSSSPCIRNKRAFLWGNLTGEHDYKALPHIFLNLITITLQTMSTIFCLPPTVGSHLFLKKT